MVDAHVAVAKESSRVCLAAGVDPADEWLLSGVGATDVLLDVEDASELDATLWAGVVLATLVGLASLDSVFVLAGTIAPGAAYFTHGR